MQAPELSVLVSMTGTRSVWTVAAKAYPLLTHPGSGPMTGGAGLPVQGRRDNYRIVRGARGVAAAVMVQDRHPVEGDRCSRPRMLTGRQLHSLVIPSYQPVSPILRVVPEDPGFRLYSPLRVPGETPCFLLHQRVRWCWNLVDQKSLLKELMREKIRYWYSPARLAYSCRSYPDGPGPCLRTSHQARPEQATAKRHWYRYRFPVLSLPLQKKNPLTIPKIR